MTTAPESLPEPESRADLSPLSAIQPEFSQPQSIEEVVKSWNLNHRESEIFKRLPFGESDGEIAAALGLDADSLKKGIINLFAKATTKSRIASAALAYELYRDELAPLINIDLAKLSDLTVMERYLLVVVGRSLSYREIALPLQVHPDTVSYRSREMYKKLGVNRTQTGIYLAESQKAGLISEADSQLPTIDEQSSTRVLSPQDQWQAQLYEDFGDETLSEKDVELMWKKFRSSAERAFPKIVQALPRYGKPQKGQTFHLPGNREALTDLWERGIISQEQLDAGEIDRAAIAALMIIRADEDNGFLSKVRAEQGMATIRQEEAKYFDRLESK